MASVDALAGGDVPRLEGVFVQLDRQHTAWSRQRWHRELSAMAAFGMDTLVVQWCREPDLSHLVPLALPAPRSTISTVIDVADQVGLDLYLGLHHDPSYWRRISGPPEAVRDYLRTVLGSDLAVARDLQPLLGGSRGFQGYYIPQEIDDLNWRDRDKRAHLAGFLGTLHRELERLDPEAAVIISTFARGRTSPRGFAEAWAELLAAAPLEAVLFQDGFGDGGLSAGPLVRYLEELGAIGGPARIWSVVEAFHVLEQGEGVFRAESARFTRVQEQLRVAAKIADRRVAFSLRYLSSEGGTPGAGELAAEFRRYLEDK